MMTYTRDIQTCFYCSGDLNLDLMTFVYEVDLYPIKMYPRSKKMNFLGQGF